MTGPGAHLLENPFFVLELRPGCTWAEVEREGQKWLGMLELKLGQAASYLTPLGRASRTPEKVRQAMAELRDPLRRVLHEPWAALPVIDRAIESNATGVAEAWRALGF